MVDKDLKTRIICLEYLVSTLLRRVCSEDRSARHFMASAIEDSACELERASTEACSSADRKLYANALDHLDLLRAGIFSDSSSSH